MKKWYVRKELLEWDARVRVVEGGGSWGCRQVAGVE
jgi:hypothetical protein